MEVFGNSSSMEETQAGLEKRLKEAMEARDSTEASVQWTRKELDRLFGKKGPNKPTETIEDIEDKIASLELERTISSMTLQEERSILKQIHKLQLLKSQIHDYMKYDQNIKAHKKAMGNLRASLKEHQSSIAEIKTELGTVNIAVELGCGVGELVGTKIDCPESKLGRIIGKKGKNIHTLMKTTNTNVDIEKTDIRLIGTLDSLQAAKTSLEKTITRTEETITVSEQLIQFLTAAKITALQELRKDHPDVWFQVRRGDSHIVARGSPSEIQNLREALKGIEVFQEDLDMTPRESGFVVGKGGRNVARLVETYQVCVEVAKPEDGLETSRTSIIGPSENIALAKADIEGLLNDNKETEMLIPIQEHAKTVLLLQGGAGIQALQKQVNQNIDGFLLVHFSGDSISVKGRAKYMETAEQTIKDEVKRVDSQIKTIQFDPVAIPVLIGKKGEAIKKLREGTQVAIEVDRNSGRVTVGGLDANEVHAVLSKIEAVKTSNQVHRIVLDDCRSSEEFSDYYRRLLRSAEQKQVSDLVFMLGDDDARAIILRGEAEKIKQAAAIVEDFLARNIIQELSVTSEDLTALLAGGKKSKIVEIATTVSVDLHTDRDRQIVVARGEKEKVSEAMKLIREYLHGSARVLVRRIDLGQSELMGVVIGRGGKTKMELEQSFPSVSILVPRSESIITLRGDAPQVKECEVEIRKLVANATVTRTIELGDEQLQELKKSGFTRRLRAMAPVSVHLISEKSTIQLRGTSSACEEATILLKEELEGIYETSMKIHSMYNRFKASCINPEHLNLIMKQSNATVFLNDETNSIVLHGTRQQVLKAKESLLTFLEFILGENMYRYSCEKQQLQIIGSPATMAEISVLSGAHIFVDKQISSVLVFSAESEEVKAAAAAIEDKIKESESLLYTLQLHESEDWLIAKIIGNRGSSISKLRKTSGCDIRVVSQERRIIVSAESPEKVTKGREIIDILVETFRQECAFVSLPIADDLAAFVGRAGVNIKNFSKEHDVEVHLTKTEEGKVVRITGNKAKVKAARTSLEAWISSRAAQRLKDEVVETKTVRPDHIPAIIGQSGSVINGIRKEFKCKVDVDSANAVISVRDASPETVKAIFAKIDSIVVESDKEVETKQLEKGVLSAVIGAKGATINGLQKEFDCKLDIDRDTALLSIRGVSDENREALLAKIDSIISHEQRQKEIHQPETKHLDQNDLPVVIGTRGSTISSLQSEFRCKIDIDKKTSVLTVRGGTSQDREALFAKIDGLIQSAHEGGTRNNDSEAAMLIGKENDPQRTKQPEFSSNENPVLEADFPSLAPPSKLAIQPATGALWTNMVSDPSQGPAELELMD